MNLPNSGRVVVLDDTFDEIKGLLNSLSKQAIPYVYYDGRPETLPDKPLEGIRFIFLDIELPETKGMDDKNKATALIGRLKKIISVNNGPYVIIYWTKHPEVIEFVNNYCKEAKIPPTLWIDLEKPIEGELSINEISSRIQSELSKLGAFQLYVEWENVVHSSVNEFINDFASLIPNGDEWSTKTSALFYKLYKTYVDKNVFDDCDHAEQFKCASILMNMSFADVLHRFSFENLNLPSGFRLSNSSIEPSIISKLNTSLFLTTTLLNRPSSGHIYYKNDDYMLNILSDSIFKEGHRPLGLQLCKVILTPECDLAQNKVLKFKDGSDTVKIQRIVYGILFNYKSEEKDKIKQSDAHFSIGPFWFDNEIKLLTFHFLSVSFIKETDLNGSPILSLRRDILFDIQSKAASHANRLGNFQLSL